ncbi:MAG: hypothetical protein FJ207_08040 [Gemmatimonadetes bacterium]|nr:hypothetical protein [Gemmatimonadota bacterium]
MNTFHGKTQALTLAMVTLAASACDTQSTAGPMLTDVAVESVASLQGPPPFVFPDGCCFYDGTTVRTVVPPAASPKRGRDDFYAFPGAAAPGQKAVVAVAPGDQGYHSGQWKFHAVTWIAAPTLLTSAADILQAAQDGLLTITRVEANDFKCPIQP